MRLKAAIEQIKECNFDQLSEVRHYFINCSFVLVSVYDNNCIRDKLDSEQFYCTFVAGVPTYWTR